MRRANASAAPLQCNASAVQRLCWARSREEVGRAGVERKSYL